MKNYTITVNGTAYDVTVEEGSGSGAPSAAAHRIHGGQQYLLFQLPGSGRQLQPVQACLWACH